MGFPCYDRRAWFDVHPAATIARGESGSMHQADTHSHFLLTVCAVVSGFLSERCGGRLERFQTPRIHWTLAMIYWIVHLVEWIYLLCPFSGLTLRSSAKHVATNPRYTGIALTRVSEIAGHGPV